MGKENLQPAQNAGSKIPDRMPDKSFEYKGKKYSIRELAEMFHVVKSTMFNRIQRYGSPEPPPAHEAMPKSQKCERLGQKATLLTWNGESKTAAQWAIEMGCSPEAIRHRFRRYNSQISPYDKNQALTYEYNGETHTAAEWATIVGVSIPTVKKRLKDSGNPYEPTEKKPTRLLRRPDSAIPIGEYDRIDIEDVSPEEYNKALDDCDPNMLLGVEGDWVVLEGWAFRVCLPIEDVAANFKAFGCPTDPDDPMRVVEIPERRQTEGYKAYLKAMSRILKKPDDGRPLKEILGDTSRFADAI